MARSAPDWNGSCRTSPSKAPARVPVASINGTSSLRSCLTSNFGIFPSSPEVRRVLRKKYPKTSRKEPKMNVRISPEDIVASNRAAPTTKAMNNNVLLVLSLCCFRCERRSEIMLEPRPAGTVLILGSFSSS